MSRLKTQVLSALTIAVVCLLFSAGPASAGLVSDILDGGGSGNGNSGQDSSGPLDKLLEPLLPPATGNGPTQPQQPQKSPQAAAPAAGPQAHSPARQPAPAAPKPKYRKWPSQLLGAAAPQSAAPPGDYEGDAKDTARKGRGEREQAHRHRGHLGSSHTRPQARRQDDDSALELVCGPRRRQHSGAVPLAGLRARLPLGTVCLHLAARAPPFTDG
jgi:hypothetical protein